MTGEPGGVRAIRCECYTLDARISKAHLDSPIAVSASPRSISATRRATGIHRRRSSPTPAGARRPDHSQVGERSIRFAGSERAVLRINDHTSLCGVPAEAHVYRANGRTPIERPIDSYRTVRDRGSGIVNDLNGWFDAPEELVATIRRIVYISGQTAHIVAALPKVVAGWATTAVRAVVPDGAQAAGHKMETWKCREIDPCPDNPAQKIFLFSRCPDDARIDERDAVMSGEYIQSLFWVD